MPTIADAQRQQPGAMNQAFVASLVEAKQNVLTISGYGQEELGPDKDKKPVLYFRGTAKFITLNQTRTNLLAQLFGEDAELDVEMRENKGLPPLRVKLVIGPTERGPQVLFEAAE